MATDGNTFSGFGDTHMQFTMSHDADFFDFPEDAFLIRNPGHDCVIVAAVVLNAPRDRVLLVQRSANDSLPGLWEVPGGMCFRGENILQGVARELWEESHLRAKHIGAHVGADVFGFGDGKLAIKHLFLVEVESHDKVKLDAVEHQNFVWATMEEVRAGGCGDVELKFTSRVMVESIAEAFKTAEGY